MSDFSEYEADFILYFDSLSQDPLATVLRVHLLTEFYLEIMIKTALPKGEKLFNKVQFKYAQKLEIVKALDVLPAQLTSSLKNLNKLRNSFSHERFYEVSEKDLEKIGSSLGSEWTRLKNANSKLEDLLVDLCGSISMGLAIGLKRLRSDHEN